MIRELSPADLRRFYDDGYLILEGLFSRAEVAEMAAAAERLRAVGRELAVALPAGYTEDGEQPIDSARRELREETGYEAKDWRSLGSYTVDGNYGLCIEHAYLALDARLPDNASVTPTGDLEDIEVFTASLPEALEMLEAGGIAQLSSASALALAALAMQRLSGAH